MPDCSHQIVHHTILFTIPYCSYPSACAESSRRSSPRSENPLMITARRRRSTRSSADRYIPYPKPRTSTPKPNETSTTALRRKEKEYQALCAHLQTEQTEQGQQEQTEHGGLRLTIMQGQLSDGVFCVGHSVDYDTHLR